MRWQQGSKAARQHDGHAAGWEMGGGAIGDVEILKGGPPGPGGPVCVCQRTGFRGRPICQGEHGRSA